MRPRRIVIGGREWESNPHRAIGWPTPGLKSGRPTGSDSLPLGTAPKVYRKAPPDLAAKQRGSGFRGRDSLRHRMRQQPAVARAHGAGRKHAGHRRLESGIRLQAPRGIALDGVRSKFDCGLKAYISEE